MTLPGSSRFVLALVLSIAAQAQSPMAGEASQTSKLPQKAKIFQKAKSSGSPALRLTPNTQSAQPNQNIHFTAAWNTNVYRMNYHFDWGDHQSNDSGSLEADHAYVSPGTYTVRVIATSQSPTLAKKMPGIYSNDVSITITPPPSASKKGKPKQPQLPHLTLKSDIQALLPNQTVHFTASWDRQPYVEKYTFDWGDGLTSEADAPDAFHSYGAAGTRTVRAIANITWNDETIAVTSNIITVDVSAPITERVARLDPDTSKVRVGEPVTFTATVTPPSPIVQYHFAFGDGVEQDSASNRIDHTYQQAQSVQATVTAMMDGGTERVTSSPLDLTIWPRRVSPHLTITTYGKFIAGEDVTVQASLEPFHKDARFEFDWGDGTPPGRVGIQGRATHRYARKGTYNITAITWLSRAESGPVDKSVYVVIQPRWIPLWLIVLAALGTAGAAAYLIKRRFGQCPPGPEFHVTAFPGTNEHIIAHIDRSVARLSLTLKAGMDATEHNLIFPKRAAASD